MLVLQTLFLLGIFSSQLDLLRLNTGSQSRVVTACTMLKRMLFRYQGHISAALVLGGVDATGPHLYQVRFESNDIYYVYIVYCMSLLYLIDIIHYININICM